MVADCIRNNFYVDGADTVEEAIKLQRAIHSRLASAGFMLRKYRSNSSEFLNMLDKSMTEQSDTKMLGSDSFAHVLGIKCCKITDRFQ